MSIENTVCMGCLVDPNWYRDFTIEKKTPIYYVHHQVEGLTEPEKQILENLVSAWNQFSAIETKESSLSEFLDGIHRCQQLMALRVARRVNPEVWIQG